MFPATRNQSDRGTPTSRSNSHGLSETCPVTAFVTGQPYEMLAKLSDHLNDLVGYCVNYWANWKLLSKSYNVTQRKRYRVKGYVAG